MRAGYQLWQKIKVCLAGGIASELKKYKRVHGYNALFFFFKDAHLIYYQVYTSDEPFYSPCFSFERQTFDGKTYYPKVPITTTGRQPSSIVVGKWREDLQSSLVSRWFIRIKWNSWDSKFKLAWRLTTAAQEWGCLSFLYAFMQSLSSTSMGGIKHGWKNELGMKL